MIRNNRGNNRGNVLPEGTCTQKADTIKKGCYILIEGKPCQVHSVSDMKGSYFKFVAYGLDDQAKYIHSVPQTADCLCPIVRYTMYQIRNISSTGLLSLSTGRFFRAPLPLPSVLPEPHVRGGANPDCDDTCEPDCGTPFLTRHIDRLKAGRKLFAVVRSAMKVEQSATMKVEQVLGIETRILDPPEPPPRPLE